MRRLRAQTKIELLLAFRRRENVLVSMIFPAAMLAFFSFIPILPVPTLDPMAFLLPGTLTLAIVAVGMVANGISTGFDRAYLVLKRLGSTPLGRPNLVVAKAIAVGGVEVVSAAVLAGVALVIGWEPAQLRWGHLLVGMVLGTATFGSAGVFLAGRLKAETNLAVANALFLALILVGGVLVPVVSLPAGLASISRLLPTLPLSDLIASGLGFDVASSASIVKLGGWAAGTTALAALTFRWE